MVRFYSWCITVPFDVRLFSGSGKGDGASSWCRTFMPNGRRSSWCLRFMQGGSRGRLRGKRPSFLVSDFYAGPGAFLLVGGFYSWCITVPFGVNRFAGQVRGWVLLPCRELLFPTGSAPPSGRVLFLAPSGGPFRGLRTCPERAVSGCPGGALPCGYLLPPVHHGVVRREPLFTVGQGQALPSMWPPFMRNGKRSS